MGRRSKKKRLWKKLLIAAAVIAAIRLGFEIPFYFPKRIRPPEGIKPVEVEMKTTSYCHCSTCCGYNWFLFLPYQKTGFFSFRLKHVGIGAAGTKVRLGSIAADTDLYPFGTVMYIPGYGYGRVEDRGGAIKGQHIDLYRPNHFWARSWGVRQEKVKVWVPPAPPSAPEEAVAPESGQSVETNMVSVLPEEG